MNNLINYDFQKLHPHTGKVSDIQTVITKLKNKPFYKDTIRELQIRLVNNTQYFTISTHSNFNDITRTISKGDTVTIYTKDKVFGIFGYGNPQTIAHLVKTSTNKILIDFHEKQQSFASIIILVVLANLISFFALSLIIFQHDTRRPIRKLCRQ